MSGHILKNYDDELRILKDNVLEMGAEVIEALEKSVNGLLKGDREICAEVIEEDEVIDSHEKAIDELGMSILLRFNPVASDLRLVLSSINVCRSLERIGDHAVNIAKRSRKILKGSSCEEVPLVDSLFVKAHEIVSKSLTAYSDIDEEEAHKVIKMDAEVDERHGALSRSLTSRISEQGGADTKSLLHLLFISRSLERIGDLAVNVAEDIVFITSAEDIRHT